MKYLYCTHGEQVKVDDHIFPMVKGMSWCLNNRGYPHAYIKCDEYPEGCVRKLHQIVKAIDQGACLCDTTYADYNLHINHINHDKLDARLENLEIISSERNSQMQEKKSTHSSQFRGVSWHKARNKWQTQIKINGKRIHLGRFDSEEEAAQAYDEYIMDNNLDRELNFPLED